MFDQLFDSYRKAARSWMQMQQDMLRHLPAQRPPAPPTAAEASADWSRNLSQRWLESATEMMSAQGESLDKMHDAGLQIIEQSYRLSEAKSPDELRRLTEDLWRKLFNVLKEQSEAQARDAQKWAGKSFDMAQPPHA